MKSEFFCNKCLGHKNIKFLAYRFGDSNNKACCKDCDKSVAANTMKATREVDIKLRNKKIDEELKARKIRIEEKKAKLEMRKIEQEHNSYDY